MGELLQVRDFESAWEGAAERVLRNFGLSLLVADEHYFAVSNWVNDTHLRGRVVYYRVRTQSVQQRGRHSLQAPASDSLVNKIQVHPDTPFYSWLQNELNNRFDYTCCDSQDQFRREMRAITLKGQTKGRGERHEKDDTYKIDDRSRYVLGWSNEEKLAVLRAQRERLEQRVQEVAATITKLGQEGAQLKDQLRALFKLQAIREWALVDWQLMVLLIDKLTAERRELESASDTLRSLTAQLDKSTIELRDAEQVLSVHQEAIGKTNGRIEEARQSSLDAHVVLRECAELAPLSFTATDDAFDDEERARLVAQANEVLNLNYMDSHCKKGNDYLLRAVEADKLI